MSKIHSSSSWENILYGFSVPKKQTRCSTKADNPSPCSSELHLGDLPPVLQLQAFEFLDLSSLTSLLQVNKATYEILKAPEHVKPLWKPLCEAQWPWLKEHGHDASVELVDDFAETPNHAKLLDLAISKSHGFDESLFAPLRWSPTRHVFRPCRNKAIRLLNNKKHAVQYTGALGVGDRSVRADEPLPRPLLLRKEKKQQKGFKSFLRLRKRKNPPVPEKPKFTWKPFVAPYAGSYNRLHLTPRLVSYYEVTILEEEKKENGNNNDDNKSTNAEGECVAVGLGTSSFDVHQHGMPGWNKHSFGFHGDDGGIYHGDGSMIHKFSKPFGVGDIIGCGVDYERGAIFFTMNGEFLGYAFELEEPMLKTNLYPVIGMDTHSPLQCNFGIDPSMPFEFDLSQLIMKNKNKNTTNTTVAH